MEFLAWLFGDGKIFTIILSAFLGFILKLYTDDRRVKREEIRKYLVEAYSLLEGSVYQRSEGTSITKFDLASKMQRSLELVQLYGTVNQVEMARKIIDELRTDNVVDLTLLQTDLRDDLRKMLRLKKVSSRWFWMQATDDTLSN